MAMSLLLLLHSVSPKKMQTEKGSRPFFLHLGRVALLRYHRKEHYVDRFQMRALLQYHPMQQYAHQFSILEVLRGNGLRGQTVYPISAGKVIKNP